MKGSARKATTAPRPPLDSDKDRDSAFQRGFSESSFFFDGLGTRGAGKAAPCNKFFVFAHLVICLMPEDSVTLKSGKYLRSRKGWDLLHSSSTTNFE